MCFLFGGPPFFVRLLVGHVRLQGEYRERVGNHTPEGKHQNGGNVKLQGAYRERVGNQAPEGKHQNGRKC